MHQFIIVGHIIFYLIWSVVNICHITGLLIRCSDIDHIYWWMFNDFYNCNTDEITGQFAAIFIHNIFCMLRRIYFSSFQTWTEVSAIPVGASFVQFANESTMDYWMKVLRWRSMVCIKCAKFYFAFNECLCNNLIIFFPGGSVQWKCKNSLFGTCGLISNRIKSFVGYGIVFNFVLSRSSSVRQLLISDWTTASISRGFVNIQCKSSHVNAGSEVSVCWKKKILCSRYNDTLVAIITTKINHLSRKIKTGKFLQRLRFQIISG